VGKLVLSPIPEGLKLFKIYLNYSNTMVNDTTYIILKAMVTEKIILEDVLSSRLCRIEEELEDQRLSEREAAGYLELLYEIWNYQYLNNKIKTKLYSVIDKLNLYLDLKYLEHKINNSDLDNAEELYEILEELACLEFYSPKAIKDMSSYLESLFIHLENPILKYVDYLELVLDGLFVILISKGVDIKNLKGLEAILEFL